MEHLKTTTKRVKVGALGMIQKGKDKHINKIPGNPTQYEINKFALGGTAHLLKRALSM